MTESATTELQSEMNSDLAAQPARSSLALRTIEYIIVGASFCFAIVTLGYAPRNIEPNSLTDSWLSVLHRAFVQHAVWGRDVVFTYGPWGFVFGGTRSETLAWWLAARLLLASTCWYALWRIGADILPRPIVRAAWVCVGLAAIAWGGMDLQIMIVPFLLLFVAARPDGRDRMLLILLCLAAALCSWIKHSAGLMGLGVVCTVTLIDLLLRRRPLVLPIYLLASLGFFLLARQPLGALPHYLRNHWEILIGYGAAMQVTSAQAPRLMAFYLAISIVLVAIAALQRSPLRSITVLLCGALAVWFMVIFKECFVRQDQDPHLEIAAPALLLALMILVTQPSLWRRMSITLGVIALILVTFASNPIHRHDFIYAVRAIDDVFANTPRHVTRFIAIVGDLFPATRGATKVDDSEFPHIAGPVEAVPWTGPYAFDQLQFRPDFQSYAVYTPRLAQLNAEFLQRDTAPPTLLWRVDPLDHNYATMEDPLIWPEAMARYHYAGDVAGQLILSRNASGSYRLIPLRETTATLGASVEVPPSTTGRIWLKMQITATHMGTLRSIVYRPVELHLAVETADGETVTSRLCVPIMSCGFLLSPKLNETSDFKNLIEGDPQHALAPRTVRRISVSPANPGSFIGYDQKLVYRFFDLQLHRYHND